MQDRTHPPTDPAPPPDISEPDTTNRFGVSCTRSGVVLLSYPRKPLSRSDCHNLAAYLVLCAVGLPQDGSAGFDETLRALRST